MLKQIQNLIFLAVIAIGFCACEKVIDVELSTSAHQIVIEANINTRRGQTIKISQSVPYTESNSYPPVTGANVSVTDDLGRSWTFTESAPGTYTFGSLRGEMGRTYALKVNVNNTLYTATSTMPTQVPVDSLSMSTLTFGDEQRKQIQVHFRDPYNAVNQYRFVMKINGVQTKRIYTQNDRFTNGNPTIAVLFFIGESDSDNLKTGDKGEVEMQCIDKNMFTYWNTLSEQSQNGPGGGVTPGNPPSNISNNALGYFSAHTSELKNITVK